MTPPEAAERLRELLKDGHLDLRSPEGSAPGAVRQLRRLAATEVMSVGRLAEAHCDAAAIAAEAGSQLPEGALAGVWAYAVRRWSTACDAGRRRLARRG